MKSTTLAILAALLIDKLRPHPSLFKSQKDPDPKKKRGQDSKEKIV